MFPRYYFLQKQNDGSKNSSTVVSDTLAIYIYIYIYIYICCVTNHKNIFLITVNLTGHCFLAYSVRRF